MNLGKGWGQKLQKRIQGYNFEVGIIEDGPHKNPVETKLFGEPQTTSYAGEPVRKTSRTDGPENISQIFIDNQTRINTNLLLEPFQKKSSDILKFTNYFLKYVCQRPGASLKRVENLIQAIVRNPILRKEYGQNKATTADAKGFDRHLFDTGQMFKAIKARAKRV